jgi:hypothetical protein
MPDMSIWLWMAVAVVVMCAVTPWIAYAKNRSALLWLVLGLMFNPIAFVILLFLPALPRQSYRPPAAPGEIHPIDQA